MLCDSLRYLDFVLLMSLDSLFSTLKMGQGNFGHAGRPGKRGGSLPKGGNSSMSQKLEDFENEMFKNMPQLINNDYLINGNPLRDWKRASQKIVYHRTPNPQVDAVVNAENGKLAGLVRSFDEADLDMGQKPVVAMTRVGLASYFDDSFEAMKFLVSND